MSNLKLFDTAALCTHFAKQIAATFDAPIRYLARTPGDWRQFNHDGAELQAFRDAGVKGVGLVFEHRSTEPSYFTEANGREDVKCAIDRLVELGVPKDVAVYIAIDCDIRKFDLPALCSYFAEWRALHDGGWGVGIYGDRDACEAITAEENARSWGDLADHTWLANAKYWSKARYAGEPEYADWDIRQHLPVKVFGGLQVDPDEGRGWEQCGLWRLAT